MEVVRCRASGCAGGRRSQHPRFTVHAKDGGRGITGAFGFVPPAKAILFTYHADVLPEHAWRSRSDGGRISGDLGSTGQFLLKDLVLLAASLSLLFASVQGPWLNVQKS